MRVYDGESLKDTDPKAKSYQEYRDYAGVDEGMNGLSTRFAFKILSRVFNFDHSEVAANPVHLFYVLERQIEREQFPAEVAERYKEFLKGYLIPKYVEFIGKEIQTAYLESYSEYGQNLFDRYVTYADFWIQDQEYRDPETGQLFDREALNAELEKTEKPAGISNPKDFRNEIVNFVLRARANHEGKTLIGRVTKNCALSLRKRCSPIQKTCCQLFRLMPKVQRMIRKNMTISSLAWKRKATPKNKYATLRMVFASKKGVLAYGAFY